MVGSDVGCLLRVAGRRDLVVKVSLGTSLIRGLSQTEHILDLDVFQVLLYNLLSLLLMMAWSQT